MLRKSMILVPVALVGALPFAAYAERLSQSELAMFQGAGVSAQQAGETALQTHAGRLASVVFGDEDGRAAYEAVVVGADGQPWSVRIDAATGDVFASALTSDMQDHADAADHEDDDTETNDD
ncbi:MAG: PepSY domain-containing protein [Rhodobacter sp.]|nr:PepSY domain-containing protein [Rhodobacter sp.]